MIPQGETGYFHKEEMNADRPISQTQTQLSIISSAFRELRLRVETAVHQQCRVPQDWRGMYFPGPQQGDLFLDFCLQCSSLGGVGGMFYAGSKHSQRSCHGQPILKWLPHDQEQRGPSEPQAEIPCHPPGDTKATPGSSRFFQLVTRMTHTKSKLTLQVGQSIAPFSFSYMVGKGKVIHETFLFLI